MLGWGMMAAIPFTAVSLAARSPAAAPGEPAAASTHSRATGDIVYPVLAELEQGVVLQDGADAIHFANAAAARLLHVTAESLRGALAGTALADIPLPAPGDGATQFERNGRMVQARRFVLSAEETAVAQVLILNDVTARYRAERSRDQFLTTISHELRSPLTVIKGYMELLCTGAAGDLTARQADFAEQVQRQADHLVDLINSLIFVSSVRGGRLEYTGGLTDLDQIMRQMARELSAQASAQGVTIRVDVAERLSPIQADPIHMGTVVKELLRNAIKYSHRGGAVTARAALQVEEAQSFAVVSVTDEGIGIDPAEQAYIFETFLRSDQSDTQVQAGGMGIGLPIVRALVEVYNGRIWFDSTPDQGSTFFFLVPTEQPDVAVLPSPRA
jgi:signal transduction histidine kinase